jgi:hypothetical protein
MWPCYKIAMVFFLPGKLKKILLLNYGRLSMAHHKQEIFDSIK